MAINIKFDLIGNPEPPSIVLANRNGNKLGQLDVNVESIELSDKFNAASEFSFTLNKYIDDKLTNLWDKVVDFKLVYCKEWDMWFEIKVELDEATETVKTVFCTQLGQAELSQIMLYNIEINTEEDITRDDYKISILYDADDHDASILHRLLSKAPHYSIAYVDETVAKIQRQFSFDDTSICDAFNKIGEEIGCLFVYNSNSDANGKIQRTISVYDLQQNCNNKECGYRGEFTDICPKCGETNIRHGYGEDTTIFVTSDELATEGIQLVVDTDSVKNCFKLEAGDDLMTATIRNCNPNGSDYIWYFSETVKEDMSNELVDRIESYGELYKDYYNNYESALNIDSINNYNSLVEKYKKYYNTTSTCLNCDYEGFFDGECPQCNGGNILTGKRLQSITTPIIGYPSLMNTYYNTIDLALYLQSSLLPTVKMSDTSAQEQADLLVSSFPSTVAVNNKNIESISKSTADSAVLSMAKIIVRSTYKVEIDTSTYDENTNIWTGNFSIINYSDDTDKYPKIDTDDKVTVSVKVDNDTETFVKQKIDKALNKENTEDYSISGLFEKDYDDFCAELKKYALNPLKSFYDACDTCINILIDQGAGNKEEKPDLYEKLYEPYYKKSSAIASEMKIREDEISIIEGVWNKIDEDNQELIVKGLQQYIEECRNTIQDALIFEKYLGKELWEELCSYRREDKYHNDNYISDGLNNAELFENALEFIEVAENEIYKSAELQHSISATLNNLLSIEKFKPLVKSFKNGNWIRVRVDDKVYKLRLLKYDISYNDFNNISVDFSDVTKIKNGTTDVQNIFSQASSIASSYNSVQRQAKKGNVARGTIDQWIDDGLNTSNVPIQSNNNEEVIITKNGLLARSYDDINGTYLPEQLKITNNIIAYTDDNWETTKQSIGKRNYKIYDKEKNDFVEKIGYGTNSEFVDSGYISGSQIIGGDIYSDNYSVTNRTGSYLNLRDGTFSFGGGSLRFEKGENDESQLIISSPSVVTKNEVTAINEEYLKTTSVYAQNLQVNSAKIQGQLTAGQINTTGLIAENISGTTIDGKTITGGSLFIGDKNTNTYAEINASGKLICSNADIKGGGTIAGFNIGNNSIYNAKTSYDDTENNGVYLGTDGIGLGKGRFYVNNDGYLYADDGYFSGTIIANDGGYIGGWNISNSTLTREVDISDNGFATWVLSDNIKLTHKSDTLFDTYLEFGWNIGSEMSDGHIYPIYGFVTNSNLAFQVGTNRTGQLNGTWVSENDLSDMRIKNSIDDYTEEYDILFDNIRPRRYKYNNGTSDRYHTGFVAQELVEAIEDAGLTTQDFAGVMLTNPNTENERWYLRRDEFVSLNTWQIQKAKTRIATLENYVQKLEERIAELENKY